MTLALDNLSTNVPIVDNNGRPTKEFMIKWQQLKATTSSVVPLATAAQVSAVLDLIAPNPGDMLIRGSSAWEELALGAPGDILVAGASEPAWETFSGAFDAAFTGSQGSVFYKAAGGWGALAPGAAGQFLETNGAGANPSWAAPPSGPTTLAGLSDVSISSPSANQFLAYNAGISKWDNAGLSSLMDSIFSSVQGDLLYRGATGWAALAPGTAGQFLSTGGAGANPSWATGGGGSSTLAGLSDVSLSSPTNGQVLTYNSGTSKWDNATPSGGGGANPPSLSVFNYQVLASGVSVSTNYVAAKGLTFLRTDGGTGSDIAGFLGAAVPSTTPWSVTMQVRQINLGGVSFLRTGMALYSSSSAKSIFFGFNNQNGSPNISVFSINANLSGYNSGIASYNIETYTPTPEWFQVLFDGTTYTFNISFDGGTWLTVGTETAAAYLTATHIGLMVESYNSWSVGSVKAGAVCINYSTP